MSPISAKMRNAEARAVEILRDISGSVSAEPNPKAGQICLVVNQVIGHDKGTKCTPFKAAATQGHVYGSFGSKRSGCHLGSSESMWKRLLAKQKKSGESIRAFCRREGLDERQFHRWRRRLITPLVEIDESAAVLGSIQPKSKRLRHGS